MKFRRQDPGPPPDRFRPRVPGDTVPAPYAFRRHVIRGSQGLGLVVGAGHINRLRCPWCESSCWVRVRSRRPLSTVYRSCGGRTGAVDNGAGFVGVPARRRPVPLRRRLPSCPPWHLRWATPSSGQDGNRMSVTRKRGGWETGWGQRCVLQTAHGVTTRVGVSGTDRRVSSGSSMTGRRRRKVDCCCS